MIITQFDPGGPIAAVAEWTAAVLESRHLVPAWPLMTPELRRKFVDAWIKVNAYHPMMQDRPEGLRDALTADDPTDQPLWSGFAMLLVDEFHEKWSHINPDHCGFLSHPRPIGVDRELVLYVDKGTPNAVVFDGEPDEELASTLPFVGFVTRHDGEAGWLIEDFELDGRLAGQPLS